MKTNRQLLIIHSALIMIIACMFIFTAHAQAKPRVIPDPGRTANVKGLFDAGETREVSPAEIERRFRPYLEQRINRRQNRGANVRAARPSAKDYIALMKAWGSLSPEFQNLYNDAARIPAGFDSHVSPMGTFRIYYTTEGRDSIHPSGVDTIGYGGGSADWRVRRSASNGVPDYIDEVAFAFDSAWSMLVDRFGFTVPIPDSGDIYRVLVCDMDGFYGMAHPVMRRTAAGFASMVEINANWSDESLWGKPLGYDKDPYPAVRVTAAHEFFHSVQYAAAWNVYNYTPYIDDYPEAWLEGAATLMEEIAHPDVNDYLQYIGEYFRDPRASLLNDGYDPYMNSVLFKYLYEKTSARGDSIGFVKSVMDNKRSLRGLEFFRNLDQTAKSYSGKSWAEILNGFHAESYFAGSRARPWAFVSDAGLMRPWAMPAVSQRSKDTLTVRPQSVGIFRYEPRSDHPDTLYLNIAGAADNSAPGHTWAASLLVMEQGDSVGLRAVQLSAGGIGAAVIPNWKNKRECLLILTNASPKQNRLATVTPSNKVLPPPGAENENRIIVSNKAELRGGKPIVITSAGRGISELKVMTPDGKVLDYYKNSGAGAKTAKGSGFKDADANRVEWHPGKKTVPGVYYLFVGNGGGKLHKRKIVIVP